VEMILHILAVYKLEFVCKGVVSKRVVGSAKIAIEFGFIVVW